MRMNDLKTITEEYYINNAKKLHDLTDQILIKLQFVNIDNEDFYSLANEIFVNALNRYDGRQDFSKFLYFQLSNKFKTEMTRRNRIMRKAEKNAISYDIPINTEKDLYLRDILSDSVTTEDKVFKKEGSDEEYSSNMRTYLNQLSPLQKKVLELMSLKYSPYKIMDILHITRTEYTNCYNAIHAYKNIYILM